MRKLNHLQKVMVSGLIAASIIMMFGFVLAPVSYTWYWSSDVNFGLSSYSTAVSFSSNIHLGSFSFNDGTSLTLNDIYMGDGNVDTVTLSSQTSNMTVTKISSTELNYTVTGSGTQVINLGDSEPNNVRIDGVTVIEGIGYTYSGGNVTVSNALSDVALRFTENTTNIYIPTSRGEYTTENWYFRSDTWTVNTELGYKLHTSQSDNTTYVQTTSASLQNFTVGIKVYRVNDDGDVIPITDSVVGEVTQDGLTSGTLLNTTYTLSGDVDDLELDDAIQIVLYHQLESDTPVAKATYVTRNLKTNELNTNTWTISYYVSVTLDAGTYYYRFHYGDSSTDSKIVNIQYVTLDPWGTSLYYLGKSDLISFVINPYSYYIGQELVFGIFVMIFAVTGYNRYRDLRPIMVIFLLFGGTGGFLTAFIPAVAIKLSFLFLAIGIAIMLYKLIR